MSGWPNKMGASCVRIALIDGRIDCQHECLRDAAIEQSIVDFEPSEHATFLASMLVGSNASTLGMCKRCTLVSIPVQDAAFSAGRLSAIVAARRISAALREAVMQRVDVIQLSMEFFSDSDAAFGTVVDAIAFAQRSGVRTVIAAGNHPALRSSVVLSAPGAVPVAMADHEGMPSDQSPLSTAVGLFGLLAPGTDLPGAASTGYCWRTGSSFAASFVTAAFASIQSRNAHWGREAIWGALPPVALHAQRQGSLQIGWQ